MTPFNTGKVAIGLRYTPALPALPAVQGDAVRLQTALLDSRTASKPGWLGAIFGFFWRFM